MYGGRCAFQNRLGYSIVGRKFTVCALFDFLFGGHFQVQTPEGLIFGRAISRRFFVLRVGGGGGGGRVFGGAYTWSCPNFFLSA